MTAPDVLPPASPAPSLSREAFATICTVAGVVLLGAPLGLLWAAVAPPVEVVVAAGGGTRLADPTNEGFIAVDAFFFGLVVLAGLVCGALAWRAGRRHGPGVVCGLVLGGLLAAEVARSTGELVDQGQARAMLESGREGVIALSVELRAESARTGWPVAAVAAHLVLTLFSSRDVTRPG